MNDLKSFGSLLHISLTLQIYIVPRTDFVIGNELSVFAPVVDPRIRYEFWQATRPTANGWPILIVEQILLYILIPIDAFCFSTAITTFYTRRTAKTSMYFFA